MPSIVRIVLSARARVPVLVRVRFELILIPVMVEYHDGGEVMADLSPWLKTATGVTDEHMEEASVILRGTDWDCSVFARRYDAHSAFRPALRNDRIGMHAPCV